MDGSPGEGDSPLTVCNSARSNVTCKTAAVLILLCAIVLSTWFQSGMHVPGQQVLLLLLEP
jgi:hypothetical protein